MKTNYFSENRHFVLKLIYCSQRKYRDLRNTLKHYASINLTISSMKQNNKFEIFPFFKKEFIKKVTK